MYEAFTAALPAPGPGIEARARADGLRQSHAVDRVVELVGIAFPEQDAVREAVPLEPCLVLVGRKNPDDRIDCRVVERFECFVVPEKWTLLISNRPAVAAAGESPLSFSIISATGHPVTIELYRLMRELRRICTPA